LKAAVTRSAVDPAALPTPSDVPFLSVAGFSNGELIGDPRECELRLGRRLAGEHLSSVACEEDRVAARLDGQLGQAVLRLPRSVRTRGFCIHLVEIHAAFDRIPARDESDPFAGWRSRNFRTRARRRRRRRARPLRQSRRGRDASPRAIVGLSHETVHQQCVSGDRNHLIAQTLFDRRLNGQPAPADAVVRIDPGDQPAVGDLTAVRNGPHTPDRLRRGQRLLIVRAPGRPEKEKHSADPGSHDVFTEREGSHRTERGATGRGKRGSNPPRSGFH
jgi:hypothetical protein